MNEELKGLIVPVLTPFDDAGSIDAAAFIRHLEFLSTHGITRIMVNGTTAEFFSLLCHLLEFFYCRRFNLQTKFFHRA